jgi:5'-methylthioadenosine phosphorylase
MKTMIGVIGGSGIQDIAGLEGASRIKVKTPWGAPSDELLVGRLDGVPMAFLSRHGRGHVLSPGCVNYRANIDALKRIGCTDVVALSAVGSLREDMEPGDFVLVDQYIDRTIARAGSFFGAGCVAHVGFAHPTCARLSGHVAQAARVAGARVHDAATYLAIEGPQFSTLAESRLYRQWGADLIGMTGMPEARLAREAELCYASLAMVTDFDCWHPDHGAVDVAQVVATMTRNATLAQATVAGLPALFGAIRAPCPQGCDRALTGAIMTAPAQRDPELLARLDAVAGRVV